MMECIRCGNDIPSNDCFCDVCEMVGCGCQFQPPIEQYIDDKGPYCPTCADELEEEASK